MMALPSQLVEEPPAVKLAYRTLERRDELTKQELCNDAHIHPNTAGRALETLEEHDLVRVRESTRDARQQIYTLD